MKRGSRQHDRTWWGVILGSLLAGKIAFLLTPVPDSQPVSPKAEPPAWVVALCCLAAVLFAVLAATRRGRACMRMRPRVSRPSKHGIIYLETFGISAMLDGATAVALVSVDWSLSALEFVIDTGYLRLPDFLAVAYAMVALRSIRGPLTEWGWRRGRGICRDLAIGVAAGIVIWVVYRLRGQIAAIDTLRARMVLGTVLLAPLVEETLYRGALYRYLRDRMQWLPAAIVSATIFALMHGSSQMPAAYVIGLTCALLREWRGSLVAPVATHMSWNLLAMAASGSLADCVRPE